MRSERLAATGDEGTCTDFGAPHPLQGHALGCHPPQVQRQAHQAPLAWDLPQATKTQETVWPWAKTTYEAQAATESATNHAQAGTITDELVNTTPAFGSRLLQAPSLRSSERLAMARDSKPSVHALTQLLNEQLKPNASLQSKQRRLLQKHASINSAQPSGSKTSEPSDSPRRPLDRSPASGADSSAPLHEMRGAAADYESWIQAESDAATAKRSKAPTKQDDETEDDAMRAEAQRRLKVLRESRAQLDPTRNSKPSPTPSPGKPASTSGAKPNT